MIAILEVLDCADRWRANAKIRYAAGRSSVSEREAVQSFAVVEVDHAEEWVDGIRALSRRGLTRR